MKILVTNDDGIFAQGLWVLVKELKTIAQVVVVAPDREQSAIGTAVTLRQPLRIQRVIPVVPAIETYSVEGTPADSVILALSKLVNDIDLVISGINHGLNLGDDVLISGTVGAALQGYLRGFPTLAVSVPAAADSSCLENAAKLVTLLAKRIHTNGLPTNVFLNINLPNQPLLQVKEVKITRLAHKTHIDTVEEGHDGRREYYWLVRQKINKDTDKKTDIWAIENGNISITALYTNRLSKPSPSILNRLCSDLLPELQGVPR